MSEQAPSTQTPPPRVDPVGCVGLLMILMFISVGLANILSGGAESAENPIVFVSSPQANEIAPDLVPAVSQVTATPSPMPVSAVEEVIVPSDEPPQVLTTMTVPPLDVPVATPTPFSRAPVAEDGFAPTPTPLPEANIAGAVAELPPPPTPLPTPTDGQYWATVPILMYHYVSEPPPDADIYRVDLSVHPNELRNQLTYIRDNGFTTITLYDLGRALANLEPLPEKPVILTFDDGYRDNYLNAFPLLQEFGMTGTFFIVTGFVDSWNENYMTWPMVEEMAAAGMDMEIHTVSHPGLHEIDREDVVKQIANAQETLEMHIGRKPRYLAYPGGRYNDEVIGVVRELDLWGAVTTNWGTSHEFANRYEIERLRMRYTTTIAVFADMINTWE